MRILRARFIQEDQLPTLSGIPYNNPLPINRHPFFIGEKRIIFMVLLAIPANWLGNP
jgi:hypothetical protein